MTMSSKQLIESYYAAFNEQDIEHFLSLLSEDIVHDINQGRREIGKEAFGKFLEHMNQCYEEKIIDLVIMMSPDGKNAAAEFKVLGTYIKTDEGLPPASGQTYQLPAGAFFEIRDAKIARISNTYNLNDWLRQVAK
jgi:steroid delta-isomerase-like uncharacterized protein